MDYKVHVTLIGITVHLETYTDSRGCPTARYVSPQPYVEAVARAGGQAVLLPHLEAAGVGGLLEHLDGLLIAGGDFDVPPSYYGETPRPGLGTLQEERSAFERALCEAALQGDVALLGVCGGMQLLNVVLGGTLYQDLAERPGSLVHEQPHDTREPQHGLQVMGGTRVWRLCGGAALEVNSTHHQVVRDVPDGLEVAAVAPDGVVEAIEVPGAAFALGVQWHPELLAAEAQRAIYSSFVEVAASRSAKPSK